MSKLETDIFLMTTFSKEFKKIEDECKQKASINANICSENLSTFKMNKINDDVTENPKVLTKVNEILSQCGLDAWHAKKESEKPKKNPGANVSLKLYNLKFEISQLYYKRKFKIHTHTHTERLPIE